MLCLALLLPLAWAAQADSTCERHDAKGTSLLSLKADAVRSRDTRDIFADVVSTFADNASAANDSNASWQCVNQSLHQSVQDLVTNVMVADVNQTNTVPNPEGNCTDPQNRTGLGKLSQSLEFLYLKVAQLETAVELQSIEYRISKQALDTALVKIQQLEDKLDHKEAQYQQLSAKLSHHQSTSKHGEGELEEPEPVAGNKRYKAWMAAAPRRQKEHETRMGQKAHEVLKDVLLKHHRQSDTKDWHRPAPKAARSSNSSAKSSSEALLQRRSAELDSTVSAKGIPIVDDVVDAATDVGNAVVDGANTVAGAVTDGTGLIGDALTDAYNQAADKVSFVANTVINTVEQAVAILINGFDFSAGCPHWVWPSLGVSNTDITIGFGRQMCEVVLVGQRLTLFDFNWGTLTVPFPAPIAAMVAMGSNLVNCISSGGAPFDIFKCVAVTIGETLLQVVPPFSILSQLGSMLSEFLAFFAELASAAITAAVGETTSLVQDAVSLRSFPSKGEAPKLVSTRKGLTAHVRRNEHRRKVFKSSMMQTKAKEEPDDTMGSGAMGIATTEAMPYATMLISQFGGDEYDTGSCLGFAPAHRTGPGNTVTQRDWQVPSPESTDFVKLEPWGVPCDNQWAKDNPGKWEGYSFYTYESVIEKCVAVSYTMSAQPVLAFVGGLEFDLMPSPLAEISTEVCWPDRVTAPDLSLIVTTIRTAGLVLFKHTIRLHKRFGTDTAFQAGNIKDAIERGRNYFGKGTSADDDKALQGMSRTALNQVQNSSQKERMSKHKARESKPPSVSDFEAVSEELYLASARYTTKGVKITESFEGHEAVDRARAALKKDLNVLQEDESSTANDTENSQALGNHELFELGSPSGALVGFSVRGQLSNAVMQLRVNMKFGPLDSPTKTIDLLNLVDHLRVVLAAIPFVSQASKQKAIDSMTSTNIETQIPATDVKANLPLENGWLAYGNAFGSPFYRLKDGICSLQGLISGGTWGRLGTLPAECRPGKKMIFSALVHGASARLDVTAEGRVNWAGGSSSSWITLSNTLFVPGSTGWPVPLVNGWAAYGGAFGVPSYTVKGPICIVDGLVSGGTWGHIATLPEECRPVSTQLFNANNHDRVTRLDVTPAGAISYIDGGAEYGWVSFSGIIFTTDATAQSALPVASGWTSGGGWPGPTYAVAEGLCILEGLVWGLNWGHAITYLPVECWPMQTLIFGANNGAGVIQRIDVESDGTVKHVSEGATPANGWLSLAGIAFAKETSGERKMPLRNGWVTWGDAFGDATMNMKNGLCFMEAIVLSGSTWDLLAQLPEGCWPTKRLIFTANGHDDQFRMDVTTSGVITIVTGANPSGWLSLSNIIFAPDSMGHIALPLVNGWTAYGGVYGTPDYTVRNGMCSLEGLLYKSGSSPNQQLALLPEDCRPGSGVLIFQTDNHGATARVDVYTTGEVYWIAGGAQEWVSLSGIVFATGNGGAIAYPLALQNGWGIYGDGSWFAPPQYFLSDGICSLQGLISGGTWTTFLTLPSDCRPNKVVIFDLNQHDANMRVDVYPTGEVNYITGSTAHGWVSLSGIIFEAV